MPTGHRDRRHKNRTTAALLAGRPPSHPSGAAARDQRGGRSQGGQMSTLSMRTLVALAFEPGEEFDPALTPPSAPLTGDLALLAGARALMCELSPMERRRQRERARRGARPVKPSAISLGSQARAPRTR